MNALIRPMKLARLPAIVILGLMLPALWGCQPNVRSPLVVFLDGAGHFGAGYAVRTGLERAGYIGAFETFSWTSMLGPGADHLVVARSKGKAHQLAERLEDARSESPTGKIYVMGLSAGTALVLAALDDLPKNVSVDGVVLFSSSVSSERNLGPALRHIQGRLYATCSPHDGILSGLAINADGGPGEPAGVKGFKAPAKATRDDLGQYTKVVNIPWQPSFVGFGWHGGHVEATTSGFVQPMQWSQ